MTEKKLLRDRKWWRRLMPFWGLGPNPLTWASYCVMRLSRNVRYSGRTTYEWDLDYLCLIVRLRQIRTEGLDSSMGEFLMDRVIYCDLPRMERWLDQGQRRKIEEAEA